MPATPRRSAHYLAFFAALFLLSSAQSQRESEVPSTTLRSTTRLVNVNVVVTDKQGRPVTDLTKEDFSIIDGGHEQKIGFFQPVDLQQPLGEITPPGPGTYTNVLSSHGAAPSVVVLLLDLLNAHWAAQGYSLNRIREFLRQIHPQDRIGIYVLGEELKVVHDFTRDASDLVAAIERYDEKHAQSVSAPSGRAESTGDLALDSLLAGKQTQFNFATEEQMLPGEAGNPALRRAWIERASQSTVVALQEVARQLSSVTGRKSLIWLSDKVPQTYLLDSLDPFLEEQRQRASFSLPANINYQRDLELERMVRLMNDSGIAVYTVDARGLETVDVDFRNHPNGGRVFSSEGQVDDLVARTPQVNPALLELASRTGGRAFYNRNDLETGIRQALNDARYTYSLAYYPDHGRWKGEWRKIQVKVKRPDLKVLARGGYFAMQDPRLTPPKVLNDFLAEVAASPIESTQLALTIHLNPEPGRLNAEVHFNPRPVLTSRETGHWGGNIELVFFQLDEKNKIVEVTTQTADMKLTPLNYHSMVKKGINMPVQLDLKPDTTTLSVILYDKNSGEVGSVRIPAVGPHLRQEKK